MGKRKTIILLIDFHGHPILGDEFVNNKRYSELQKLICNVNNRSELYFISNMPYSNDKKLGEILKMARSVGFKTLEVTKTLRPNEGDHTIEELSNHIKEKFDFQIDPSDTQIVIGGNNLGGCVASSKQISAVYWSKAGYRTTIHAPLCAEYEQPGLNQVERTYHGFQKLYTAIKDNKCFDISMSNEWHEIAGI
ncbi:MAG: hypothetical protein ACKVI2_04735 [Candidatus Pelagibacterales bacterium]